MRVSHILQPKAGLARALLSLLVAAGCRNPSAPEPKADSVTTTEPRLAVSSAPANSVGQPSTGPGASSAPAFAGAGVARPSVGAFPKVETSRLPSADRLVAIGDLHGDLSATRDVLRLAGAIDDRDRWVGGKLVVVQTGDQLDRGDDERVILDLLERLRGEASATGGALIVLNGNHETMNAMVDFRYVNPGAVDDFAGADPRHLPAEVSARVAAPLLGRAQAFFPGGKYAKLLARRPVVAVVGDSVFAHGGVHLDHLRYGIDRLNREIATWLRGEGPAPALVQDENSPLWSRRFSVPHPTAANCAELDELLRALGVRRLVVGHTVQREGIGSACNGKVWRIDVGMSAHYQGTKIMALEITAAGPRVLQAVKSSRLPVAAE